jgi:hypothetical protein
LGWGGVFTGVGRVSIDGTFAAVNVELSEPPEDDDAPDISSPTQAAQNKATKIRPNL